MAVAESWCGMRAMGQFGPHRYMLAMLAIQASLTADHSYALWLPLCRHIGSIQGPPRLPRRCVMWPPTHIQSTPPHQALRKPSGGYSLGYWKSREHTALKNISTEVSTFLHEPPGSRQHLNYTHTV